MRRSFALGRNRMTYDFLAHFPGECLVVRHRGLRHRGCEE